MNPIDEQLDSMQDIIRFAKMLEKVRYHARKMTLNHETFKFFVSCGIKIEDFDQLQRSIKRIEDAF